MGTNHLGSTPSSLNLLTSSNRTITADVDEEASYEARTSSQPLTNQHGASSRPAADGMGSMAGQQRAREEGVSVWQQSAHPVALFCLFLFRSLAIATYLLCGFFSDSYVFSTVLVVILLSMDFWTVRNVSGRVLVGLRFWNQVDEDGTSYWVFESRDPSQPVNAVDTKMFWTAMYAYPIAWVLLFFVGILQFNISFLPIVVLALVFNFANTIGFTYADRDAKRKWASGMAASGMLGGLGGVGGSLITGVLRAGLGKMFG